jgi:hypothetical protein
MSDPETGEHAENAEKTFRASANSAISAVRVFDA